MSGDRTTIHVAMPTKEERELLRLLTPAEKLAALVEAARLKASRLSEERGDGEGAGRWK
jgi:hypothetical protein